MHQKLETQIIQICNQSKDKGWELYHSGRYRMNGRNYAKDIVSAAEYARRLISEIENLTIASMVQLIESRREEYESIYTDMEGFGNGTLTEIIAEIKNLE